MTGKSLFGLLLSAALVLSPAAAGHAAVVRPAPNFDLEGLPKASSLRSFRGQPVVLVITRRAKESAFRNELSRLKELYSQFANEKVLFVAAFEEGPEDVPSNIPFMVAANGAQVAADYGVTGHFAIAVIGVDGNVDLFTTKVINAARVKDAVFNNFETQQSSRKLPNL
jgi:hypothetical protein